MTDFKKFSDAVHAQYLTLGSGELYQAAVDKDAFYAAYLAAFPEGTNPIFRERTEHDCSCCRNFIKNLGTVVAIKDGRIHTVWDNSDVYEYPYNLVAAKLATLLINSAIAGVYRTKEGQYGLEKNVELTDGKTILWNHFHGTVYPRHRSDSPEADAGTINSTVAVFARGLQELTVSALETVLGLIDSNALYRGAEFREGVGSFYTLKQTYELYGPQQQELFPWEHVYKPAARIRNTAIGTLLTDLSNGMELEVAVKAFEAKVAPTNYKRTTALITPKMIEVALGKLRELGLEAAVHRRFANLSDVSINNVIWADSSAQTVMKDSLAAAILASPQVKVDPAKQTPATDIGIDEFMTHIVPQALGMEVLFKNSQVNNLMSLTCSAHGCQYGKPLFKWNNDFAWSYNGNVADSIKERVKAAGGNTNAPLRVSLAWFNGDDLDIHCEGPEGHIYFRDKKGVLDVDMNAGGIANSTDPVENLSWSKPRNGSYRVFVNQWAQRSTQNLGFVIEVENNGVVSQYSYARGLRSGENADCLRFTVENGSITNLQIGDGLVGRDMAKQVWGVQTEQFVKVETLMFSPNHWDGEATGNKHWLFMLEGCKNPEPTRGIYNEYLTNELNEHRKVFEVLGAQTLCPVVPNQLSGLGFSSTRKDLVTIRVTNQQGTAQFNVQF